MRWSYDMTLGQLAFNRLQILNAISYGRNVDSLKEQLREIEKQMIRLGWDGEPHKVSMTADGPELIKYYQKPEGHIIGIKPFSVGAELNRST
jgi:hypothetical protein